MAVGCRVCLIEFWDAAVEYLDREQRRHCKRVRFVQLQLWTQNKKGAYMTVAANAATGNIE